MIFVEEVLTHSPSFRQDTKTPRGSGPQHWGRYAGGRRRQARRRESYIHEEIWNLRFSNAVWSLVLPKRISHATRKLNDLWCQGTDGVVVTIGEEIPEPGVSRPELDQ